MRCSGTPDGTHCAATACKRRCIASSSLALRVRRSIQLSTTSDTGCSAALRTVDCRLTCFANVPQRDAGPSKVEPAPAHWQARFCVHSLASWANLRANLRARSGAALGRATRKSVHTALYHRCSRQRAFPAATGSPAVRLNPKYSTPHQSSTLCQYSTLCQCTAEGARGRAGAHLRRGGIFS